MSVHYKFKSALDYDTVTFDGLHISVGDLKAAISQQKRIGKTSDFDLQITNAQTKEVYVDDHTLIPKNTSLLVARVPLAQQPKKQWEGGTNNTSNVHKDVSVNKGLADLSRMEGSEQDKINAMISQSTFDYDPSNYQKIKGQNQRGVIPPNYICFKCQNRGHWIKDCPYINTLSAEAIEIRRSTGIPRSFMVPVDGPKAPGAMMTPGGTFAVPVVDHEAYRASENAGEAEEPTNAPADPEPSIPDELLCSLCRDLLTDAVMIPCCGNSFCDECIRGALLDSEDHECPDCREKDISPTTLIPNRFLRNSVSSFRNQTGYSRRAPHRPSAALAVQPPQDFPPPGPLVQPHPNGEPNTGPPLGLKPPGLETPPNIPPVMARVGDEQRASTPTVDERREPIPAQVYNQPFVRGDPPGRRYNPHFGRRGGRGGHHGPLYAETFPPESYQPPPPGIKDSPTVRRGEDPLEAFNRMIREKEARAKRREEERRRLHSPSPRSRSSRSPQPRPRSPPPRSRSPPPRSRSPPPRTRSPPSRGSSRLRYSRSRSASRGRLRRSPWSPRRRRTRERTLSLTRSPSPRRRHRSPLRYRSPLRSPPIRSPIRTPLHNSPRSPPRSPRSPHRALRASPPIKSPHRYTDVYDELLSPPRRTVEPPYGSRYAARGHGPPAPYPSVPVKPIPIPSIGNIPVHQQPSYRGRYDPPPFEDIPPGAEPPVPGYEPPPFEKPPLGPSVPPERDRLPPANYREPPYRPPYGDIAQTFRDLPPGQKEVPNPVGDQRYRESLRGGHVGPPYRDSGPGHSYRDGQSYRDNFGQSVPYRDTNFRNGPPVFRGNTSYRNTVPFREGVPPSNYRDNNYREGAAPYRPPNSEARDAPVNYHDANFREGYRDIPQQIQDPGREHGRGGFRHISRNRFGHRRNTNMEFDRNRDSIRNERDRERYHEDRDNVEKPREQDRKSSYDRSRDDRTRDVERNRELTEKERDRSHGAYERNTPEKKIKVLSPKRNSREMREKRRSESRGRSRDHDVRKEKKEDKVRDKSVEYKNKEQKEKDRKIKDKKKKKKEKETEKKKKRDKKDKREKDIVRKEDTKNKSEDKENISVAKDSEDSEPKQEQEQLKVEIQPPVGTESNKSVNNLYDEATDDIDKETIQNYVPKNEVAQNENDIVEEEKEPFFDGLELQAPVDELDLKIENESTNEKEMLAPMPELSKWEVEEENAADKSKEPGEISSPEEEDGGKVTSEVLKRAENAIFAKAINSIRPIEIKKISSDRLKLYSDDAMLLVARNEGKVAPMNNIQITVPVTEDDHRSIDINERKRKHSKTPPPKLSVKERLGGKIEDPRKPRECIVQSTVERVKSRSKTPKRELQPYRRVTVDRERSRQFPNKSDNLQDASRYEITRNNDKRIVTDIVVNDRVGQVGRYGRFNDRSRSRSKNKEENRKKEHDNKKSKDKLVMRQQSIQGHDEYPESKGKDNVSDVKLTAMDRERKKSTLDEANFEPDYDETLESDTEMKDDVIKKQDRAKSPPNAQKGKEDEETIKLDLTNVKKKPESGSDSSSGTESSSSSSSCEVRKRKRKKKHTKRKKKRAVTESESDSDSSSDHYKKKRKKRKHKKKSGKKKKKSKHK